MKLSQISPLTACLVGIALSVTVGHAYLNHNSEPTHPIGYANNAEEVHVHSDFIVFLDGEKFDLTDDKYMSRSNQVLHADVHLHDQNGHIIHRHGHEITLADFFDSIGFTLTDTCIITDTDAEYCSNETKQLMLYIDGTQTTDIARHVNNERERLLLFYGESNDSMIETLLTEITDEACIYSGTCPERGVAPPESCGLTCEL